MVHATLLHRFIYYCVAFNDTCVEQVTRLSTFVTRTMCVFEVHSGGMAPCGTPLPAAQALSSSAMMPLANIFLGVCSRSTVVEWPPVAPPLPAAQALSISAMMPLANTSVSLGAQSISTMLQCLQESTMKMFTFPRKTCQTFPTFE